MRPSLAARRWGRLARPAGEVLLRPFPHHLGKVQPADHARRRPLGERADDHDGHCSDHQRARPHLQTELEQIAAEAVRLIRIKYEPLPVITDAQEAMQPGAMLLRSLLAEVMVAVQKSSVSFEAMVQVRNKLVDAYKEVMNMPI